MIWFILFIIPFITMLILAPIDKMKYLWRAGMISIPILYIIDSTLIWIGAFAYSYPFISGLPIFYLLSAFPSGILLCNYCPKKRTLRIPYILIASAILLIFEYFIHSLGYMQYFHWNLVISYMINIVGFSTSLWFSQCVGAFDRQFNQT